MYVVGHHGVLFGFESRVDVADMIDLVGNRFAYGRPACIGGAARAYGEFQIAFDAAERWDVGAFGEGDEVSAGSAVIVPIGALREGIAIHNLTRGTICLFGS